MNLSPCKEHKHLTYLFSSLQSCECTEVDRQVRRWLRGELVTPDLYVGCNGIKSPLKACCS